LLLESYRSYKVCMGGCIDLLSCIYCMFVCICTNHFLDSDRYTLSSVSLRTVTSIGVYAFACKYPDLLLVW